MAARSPSIARQHIDKGRAANGVPPAASQRGIALLLFVLLALGIGAMLFLSAANSGRSRLAHERLTEISLQQAKTAIIGEAASQSSITSAGYLPLPDLGYLIGSPKEGYESGSFSGNSKNLSVIGKLPWKSLSIPPARDSEGECLWYVVSGRFKKTPKTDTLNWDTQGQIDVIDGNGTLIATNIAALIVAPDSPLDSQDRTLANAAYTECGGNYTPSNYLDPYDTSNAISGQANYFTGGTSSLVAPDSGNKQFVLASATHYNDKFVPITADDIFRPIIRRSDFAARISSLLADAGFLSQVKSITISGTKGTDNLNCGSLSDSTNQTFCTNWKEMLFITQLATPASILIDGSSSPSCSQVVIFAGQKTAGQSRATSSNKADKSNYLEEPNLSAFATPVAVSSGFSGLSAFTPTQPSADVVKCVQ